MRGQADNQLPLFHVFHVEDRIRADHPLRDIERRVDRILASLAQKFDAAYSSTGRPSVPPERLLKALLLMALYSVRSERQLCERINTDLLFHWFLDLQPSDEAFDATTFTHNRTRLDNYDLTQLFFDAVVSEAIAAGLCREHFSVDGTMNESFASAKSFQPKPVEPATAETANPSSVRPVSSTDHPPTPPTNADANSFKPRNPDVDFHGQKRTKDTHQSRTDPEAKLDRKGRGKEAKLSHLGHTLAENRHGLIVNIVVTEASGTAEREAALDLLDEVESTHKRKPKTLGADKGYDDDGQFFQGGESRSTDPHVPLIHQPRGCEIGSAGGSPERGGSASDEGPDGDRGESFESEVSQEDRGRVWLAERNCGTGSQSCGWALETAAVVGNRCCCVQLGEVEGVESRLLRVPKEGDG